MSDRVERLLSRISLAIMLASVVVCAIGGTFYVLGSNVGLLAAMTKSVYDWYWVTILNVVSIELAFVCMLYICYYEIRGDVLHARYMTRLSVVALLFAALMSVVINGITWFLAGYVIQLVCVVAYQVTNDPNISENVPWHSLDIRRRVRSAFAAPFRILRLGRGNVLREVASDVAVEDAYRDRYMPLNVFNLLFVFVVGSFFGCILEDGWHIFTEGYFQERAGLVYGPLTPIYGCGAVVMTVALNRFWKTDWWRIFLVSGISGCLVEYFTSWYLESAVGVVAWDYTGTFGNINGRVNIFFLFVWGVLGLLWIRLFLPVIMRLVDAIPIRVRAVLTSCVFGLLLWDVLLTSVAMDGYSKRHLGIQPSSSFESYIADRFDDEWMSRRFEKMRFGDEAIHVRIEKASKDGFRLW